MSAPGGPAGAAVGAPRRVLAAAGVLVSIVYLLNLGFGLWAEIPDQLPIVGNIDEAAMTGLLLWSLRELFRRKGGGEAR